MTKGLAEKAGGMEEAASPQRGKGSSPADSGRRHLVLVGMMGCGKSVLGRWLGHRSGLPFYDLDRIVSRREHCSISALFEKKGEAYFRRRETEALRRTLAEPPGVLATGGGTFISEENRRLLLEGGLVFYLEAPVDLLATRLREGRGRPLLAAAADRRQTLRKLLEEREPFYRMAHLVVPVADRSREELGEWIWQAYCGRIGKTG
ncbi:Shikimate kinase (modular protein) [Methylacidimicrobium sp. AP8]|uniref:shikimate kinase n=1 Tax=Methylacidimicrobium sp. AP8 TaxID=2730359 RepID=UPI0018BFA61F|nr:shikimate kinase [Methylacidimicrobium sp. AP8]CAB4242532.1 Shikimate kinase (modular protein) [Methylacidimicrobium sp. AP8]